jgi:hypothetical protein
MPPLGPIIITNLLKVVILLAFLSKGKRLGVTKQKVTLIM